MTKHLAPLHHRIIKIVPLIASHILEVLSFIRLGLGKNEPYFLYLSTQDDDDSSGSSKLWTARVQGRVEGWQDATSCLAANEHLGTREEEEVETFAGPFGLHCTHEP